MEFRIWLFALALSSPTQSHTLSPAYRAGNASVLLSSSNATQARSSVIRGSPTSILSTPGISSSFLPSGMNNSRTDSIPPPSTTSSTTTDSGNSTYTRPFTANVESYTAQGHGMSNISLTAARITFTSSRLSHLANSSITSSLVSATGSAASSSAWYSQGNSSMDSCWAQWSNYYNPENWRTSLDAVYSTEPVQTVYDSEIYTLSSERGYTSTHVDVTTYTQTIVDGAFTLGEQTFTTTATDLFTHEAAPAVTSTRILSYTQQITDISYTTISRYHGRTPSCKLPSTVTQCQAQWDNWASAELMPSPALPAGVPSTYELSGSPPAWYSSYSSATSLWAYNQFQLQRPRCTQASMTEGLCQSLVDSYVSGTNFIYEVAGRAPVSNGWIGHAIDGTTSYFWPTSSSLAVGCTIGCGRCAVTGNSVRLLYWPPATEAPPTTPVTAVTLGTTLTSPTWYIAYSEIYASNVCKPVGSTYYNTILPLGDPNALSSQWGSPPGSTQWFDHVSSTVFISTAPFNTADLFNNPVPMSVYSSQPWCASWARDYGSLITANDNPLDVVGWNCPSTRPYEPILVIPSSIYANIDPDWLTCHGALEGLYDPPTALTPQTVAAQATLPAHFSIPAAPAQSVSAAITHPTSHPSLPSQKATAAPSPTSQPSPTRIPHVVAHTASPRASDGADPSNEPDPASHHLITTIGSHPVAVDPTSTGIVVGGSRTLRPGQQTTLSGVRISVGSQSAVVGTQTVALWPEGKPPSKPRPIATIGSETVTIDTSQSGVVIIGTHTLQPGQSTAINHTPVSIGNGVVIIDRSSTVWFTPQPTSPSHASAVLVGTQTISIGGSAAIVDGSTISLAADGLIIGSSTVPLRSAEASAIVLNHSTVSVQAVAVGDSAAKVASFTAGGEAFTVSEAQGASTAVVNGSITLAVGGSATTVDGKTISLASGGLVVDSSTVSWGTAAAQLTSLNDAATTSPPVSRSQTVAVASKPSMSTSSAARGMRKAMSLWLLAFILHVKLCIDATVF